MISRTIFTEDHEIFREQVRRFIEREITPYHAQWDKDEFVPRELWLKAGAAGLLCGNVAEENGGSVPPVARRLRLCARIPDRRLFMDTRVRRIAGGSTEIMKELIGRDLFSKR